MTTIEERSAYLKNPYFTGHIFGDYTAFYVTIGICTVVVVVIVALNVVIGCCSRYKDYWQDRHTGNRWLITIWTATPHQQPPLDLTELKDVRSFQPVPIEIEHPPVHSYTEERRGFGRGFFQHHQQQPHHQEEFVELHQRESDI